MYDQQRKNKASYRKIYMEYNNQSKWEGNYFFSNNIYLTEKNGNILGDKNKKEKWCYYEVFGDNYFFICQKKI